MHHVHGLPSAGAPIAGDRARVGVTYFNNDIANLIDYIPWGGKIGWGYYANVSRAKTSGIEALAAWTVTSRFSLRGDYTCTTATNETTGLELQRQPKHKGSATATLTPTDLLTLSATIAHLGSWLEGYARSTYVPNGGTD